jgi:hypothetical protein
MPFKILGAFIRALVSNFLGIESKAASASASARGLEEDSQGS